MRISTTALWELALFAACVCAQDITVYTDNAIASGWEDWSWSSTIDYDATDLFEGTSSISVNSSAWSALSFKYDGGLLTSYAGLKFDIAGDQPDLSIIIVSSVDGTTSPNIPLSSISTNITSDSFTTCLVPFSALPGSGAALDNGTWDRIEWQAGGNGDVYHIDNIFIVQSVDGAPPPPPPPVSSADLTVYVDNAIASGWEDWSWSSTINYDATDLFEGTSSISVNSQAYSALSLKYDGGLLNTYAGLRFDIAGDQPDLTITISSSVDGTTSPNILLSTISNTITSDAFTTCLINFSDLPGSGSALGNGTWDRLTWQAGGNGDIYHIDNIYVVKDIVIAPLFLSAEPLAANTIGVTTQGAVDFSMLSVQLNGKTVKFTNSTSYVPVGTPSSSITYLTLDTPFASGTLVIDTGVPNGGTPTFNFTLPTVQYASVVQAVNYTISPFIYGVNFPTSAQYIQDLGVTMSRWGGNAVTAYNPAGQFTNAGSDWYFENRVASPPDADDWIDWVHGAGSGSLLTIPALDWVAKDATSYSYPISTYPDQQATDPFLANAGDGLLANGSFVSPPPNPAAAYTPWNTSMAAAWLTGLANKPTLVAIDNEIEIASSTHQDMHPDPMGYDEELQRMVNTASMAKKAIPGVEVAGPSTCGWWFYWTSDIGYTDNAAHDNIDFIPWFLQQMAAQEKTTGQRLLDYLDLHYYYAADTSANDDAAKALRLRMSRSLWDTTYADESWIGEGAQQNHQWDPNFIALIPRMRTLIDINYPGTKLSLSEFSSTDDTDITGGLLTVDMLGIFGQQHLDSATYWATPDEMGPVGLAYWLYRGFGTFFGAYSAQMNIATPNPDTQGAYAGTDTDGKLTLVIVNKNPDTPIAFDLSNVPFGSYFMRHFGGEAGVAKWQTTVEIDTSSYLVIPAYTAVFLKQN
ncbi:glycoside hydrolase family 44-domain-containing protein [Roridomyces roridus]|uniref:Glycoside hydrolase family 44-domain-containing protein n=1 Tax=Roridomyces roridus TaxID=1738132 RepID=A0AAD7AYL4_9AGAR|nr:glycoside hydrolase family 44-domain-containing protein [Roridomyces roridus]